jgi:hypothetical protein
LDLAGQGLIKGENDFPDFDDDDDDDDALSDEDEDGVSFDSSMDASMFPHACAPDNGRIAADSTG